MNSREIIKNLVIAINRTGTGRRWPHRRRTEKEGKKRKLVEFTVQVYTSDNINIKVLFIKQMAVEKVTNNLRSDIRNCCIVCLFLF